MSDEESDPEAQGVDALRLLKQGSQPGLPRDATAPKSQPESVPWISLVPAQKRSRSLSQEWADEPQLSDRNEAEAEGGVEGSRLASKPPLKPWERSIRQHRSAPEQALSLKELRSCRSAPDLTLPALAAIRGLQNGTLQVDKQTRLKIAAAAKKVLEARELKRRVSQERDAQQSNPAAAPDPVSPLALKSQPLWDRPGQNLQATQSSAQHERLSASERVEDADSAAPQLEVPSSLGLAAAIASGQSPQSARPAYHRPALTTLSQAGSLLSTSHPPFTVTTGLPRFSKDSQGQGQGETSMGEAKPQLEAGQATTRSLQREPSSKLLSIGDLFVPSKDRVKG